jgi:hypothetical protein
MGRYTGVGVDRLILGKVSLRRVRLDQGGYDKGGAYWGIGEPLWYAEGSEAGCGYRRAPNRATAKDKFSDVVDLSARYYR